MYIFIYIYMILYRFAKVIVDLHVLFGARNTRSFFINLPSGVCSSARRLAAVAA